MKKYILGIIALFLLSCSSEEPSIPPKPDVIVPPPSAPPVVLTNKNTFDLKSISNLVLLNQSITIPTTGKTVGIKSTGNFFVTDNLGRITNLKIPNSSSYTLSINSLMNCAKNYILVSGDLSVNYVDGTKGSFSNFILDKTDGSFYNLTPGAYSLFQNVYSRRNRSTPWNNGEIQFDDNNSVYLKGASNSVIEEIYKVEFVKTSTELMDVKFTTINLIAESYYFNYYVLKNGDILYMHKENSGNMVWKMRYNGGQTVELNNLVNNSPFIVNGIKYFDRIEPDNCFGVRASDGDFILFVKGQEGTDNFNIQNKYIKPFKVLSNGNSMTFEAIPAKINAKINNLNTNFDLFTDYYHGMWYFKSDNFHVFTNRGYNGSTNANIWWSYDDKENVFKTNFTSYSNEEFSTYAFLLGYSNKFACVPIKRDVYFVNLQYLTTKTIKDLDFQIFKTLYRNDDILQFYGISYSSGKKVYGEISESGSVKILNEFENTVDVKEIFKIGNF